MRRGDELHDAGDQDDHADLERTVAPDIGQKHRHQVHRAEKPDAQDKAEQATDGKIAVAKGPQVDQRPGRAERSPDERGAGDEAQDTSNPSTKDAPKQRGTAAGGSRFGNWARPADAGASAAGRGARARGAQRLGRLRRDDRAHEAADTRDDSPGRLRRTRRARDGGAARGVHGTLDTVRSMPRMLAMALVQRDLGPRSPWGRFRLGVEHFDSLLFEAISRRRADPGDDSMLSVPLEQRDEDGNPPSDRHLRHQLGRRRGGPRHLGGLAVVGVRAARPPSPASRRGCARAIRLISKRS